MLNGSGKYKYLFKRGKWYVVDGLCDVDGITLIKRPMLVAKFAALAILLYQS